MNRQKILTAVACLALWGALAIYGRTPIEPFIEVLKAIIVGVFTYHTALKDPKE